MAKNNEASLLDRIHEARMRHIFMTEAIGELWGNKDSIYGDDIVFGCQLIMHDIEDKLEDIQEAMEKETTSDSKNLKLLKKEA